MSILNSVSKDVLKFEYWNIYMELVKKSKYSKYSD